MSKNKPEKIASQKTTSLHFDLKNIDFSVLQANKKIVVYDVDKIIGTIKDYAQQHNWIKDFCQDLPYYFNLPTKKVYVLHNLEDNLLESKNNEGREVPNELFTDFQNPQKAHCWINLLASEFSSSKGHINHNIFYLLSGTSNGFADVLRINLKHNYLEKDIYEL